MMFFMTKEKKEYVVTKIKETNFSKHVGYVEILNFSTKHDFIPQFKNKK